MTADFSKLPDVSEEHPELDDGGRVFAAHMKAREDAFDQIFGASHPPGQIMSPDDPQLTINWPGGGIYQFPPRGERKGWHYVTHGLAQPFDEGAPEGAQAGAKDEEGEQWSGLGIELVIATPDESPWAPLLLIDFVKYLLFNEQARLFVPGDRVPASALESYAGATELTHLAAVTSPAYEHDLLLPAGKCTLVHMVGATAAEIARARAEPGGHGTFALAHVLRALGPGDITDTGRSCTTKDPRFEEAWKIATRDLGLPAN
jgi:hypothetical protein